jgi:uncharacterized membrane protein
VNKEEFVKILREKLDILDAKEIDDIIEEYLGYIEEKVGNGVSEEEAIKDFGDIDELARELLKAYKINVEPKTREKNILTQIADTFILWMDRFVKVFSNKSSGEILKIIIELGVILLIIALCKIPFYILENIGSDMFHIFQNQFANGLFKIWKFLLELIYLISAIVLFAKIFEKRYLNNETKDKMEDSTSISNKKEKKVKEVKIEKEEPQKASKRGVIDLLATMCIWFIKFMVFWILVAMGCYILVMSIGVGIGLYFLVRGVAYYGVYLAILMLLILGILTFIICFNFIFNKKNNLKWMLFSFLTSFIILGISFSMASFEVTKTEFINEIPTSYQKETLTETINFDKNYYIDHYVNFEVDETLPNEIKFEYIYFPDYYKIKPNIKINDNRIYVDYSYINQTWNVNILDEVIENLKNRKLYNYDLSPQITIYTSSANISRLKENRLIANEQRKYQNNRYRFCQEIIWNEKESSEIYDYCQDLLELPAKDSKDLD